MRRWGLATAAVAIASLTTGCPRGRDGDHATVHVITQYGEPAAGAFVMLHAADGRFIALDEAGDDGEAKITIERGDMVTAAYAFTTDIGLDLVSVFTMADVHDGDELWLPVESFEIAGKDRGDVAFSFSGVPFVGAASYGYALAGCPETVSSNASSSGTFTHDVPADCLGEAFEPWAFARDVEGNQIAFELLPSTPLTELLANGVDFTGAWRTDFTSIGYDFTNIPAGSYSFQVSDTFYDAEERSLYRGGAASLLLGLTSTSGAFDVVPFETLSFAYERAAANSTNGTVSIVRSGAVADITVDFSSLPAFLGSATIGTAADARLQFSWTGAPPDADVAELSASYGTAENRIVIWRFRVPPDTNAPFVFPEWPDEIGGDAPPTNPLLVDLGTIGFVEGEWADWDAARLDDPRDDLETSNRRIVERLLD